MRFCILLALLVFPAFVMAQEKLVVSDVSKTKGESAQARFDALDKEIKEVVATWRKEQREASKKAREAAKKGEPIPAMSMMPPIAQFLPQFQEAARDFSGQEEAIQFLMWLVHNSYSKKDVVETSVDTLLASHINSEQLVGLARALPRFSRLLGEEKTANSIESLIQKSPHANVRGWATLSKLRSVIEDPANAIGSSQYKVAKAQLEKACAATSDAGLKSELKGMIANREQLSDGSVAPDIIGVDLDGVKFKLSDYDGKIVMLDFWGDW